MSAKAIENPAYAFSSAERKQTAAEARLIVSWSESLDRLAEVIRTR